MHYVVWGYAEILPNIFFRRGDGLKCPWHEIFLRKYLAYHMYKPIPIEEKF